MQATKLLLTRSSMRTSPLPIPVKVEVPPAVARATAVELVQAVVAEALVSPVPQA